LLKPAGVVAIWVYVWAGDYSKRLDRVRRFTVGLPKGFLYAICAVWVPIYYFLYRIPFFRRLVLKIPTSNQGCGLAWDILDTFDNYSPRYQWKHTEEEVKGWFNEARLQEVSVLGFPVAMRGRRPVA
jgi:hypothetical protein